MDEATRTHPWFGERLDHYEGIARSSETLSEFLRRFIVEDLEWAERNQFRDQIRVWVWELWDPRRSRAFLLSHWAFGRMQMTQDRFTRALSRREVHFWVVPSVAAMAFESVYELCFLFWLQEDPPANPDELSPVMQELVERQVDLFARVIGA